MQIPWDSSAKIKINQQVKPATTQTFDKSDYLLILACGSITRNALDRLPYGRQLKRIPVEAGKDNSPGPEITLDNAPGTRVTLCPIETDLAAYPLLCLARRCATRIIDARSRRICIELIDCDRETATRVVEAFAAALLAASCPLPTFRKKAPPPPSPETVTFTNVPYAMALRRTRAEAQGNHLARWLTALPGNHLTPALYRRAINQLAKRAGWRMEFLGADKLARKKAGAFLAVMQGSARTDGGIVHLRYRPKKKKTGNKKIALVGKGICFDTGGVNVKPAKHMNGMHEDMEGSAVALGTLLALTLMESPLEIDCWLAIAENHVDARSYKPNDVVTASNGTSIEIIHTDAEGRMVLADTLALAAKRKPDWIIDYATLTGACVYSLGSRYSGVFTNREEQISDLITTGQECGERVWPFPMDEDYDEALDSRIADIKQCTLEGEADHILAARFLQRFVPNNIAWIHMDLAAGNNKGGLGHIPTSVTGFGVRYTLRLLSRLTGRR